MLPPTPTAPAGSSGNQSQNTESGDDMHNDTTDQGSAAEYEDWEQYEDE